jgi:hypothetical protein
MRVADAMDFRIQKFGPALQVALREASTLSNSFESSPDAGVRRPTPPYRRWASVARGHSFHIAV